MTRKDACNAAAVSLLLALVLGCPALADSCRARPFYNAPPVYHAPTYYQPTYYEPHYVELVPKAIKTFVSPDYYFSVGDAYRDALLADAIAYRVLLGQQSGQKAVPPYQAVPRIPQDPEVPRGKPESREQPGQRQSTQPVPEKLKEVIAASCLGCHAGQQSPDFSDPAVVSKGLRWAAHGLVAGGDMPKGGKPLPDEVVVLFYQYAKSAR